MKYSYSNPSPYPASPTVANQYMSRQYMTPAERKAAQAQEAKRKRAKFFTVAVVVIVTAIILLLLREKTHPTAGEVALVMCVQQTGGSPHISAEETVLREMVEPLNRRGGVFSLISVSGRPETIPLTVSKISPPKSSDQATLDGRYDRNFKEVSEKIDTMMPSSSEIDFVKSFAMAGRSLSSEAANQCVEKKIIMMGGGRSTAGEYVNFANETMRQILLCDPESETYEEDFNELTDRVLIQMEKNGAIPDLTGIDVEWTGLGDLVQISAEQIELPSYVKKNLRGFWMKFLDRANAEDIRFSDYTDTGALNDANVFPHVTVLLFPPDELLKPVILPDSRVEFKGDLWTFVKKDLAESVLDEYVPKMSASRQKFLVLGTTATGSDRAFCLQLAENRARVVCEYFASQGIAPENLYYLGGGYETDYHMDGDINEYGGYTDIAKDNRTVVIMLYDSKTAQDLIDQFGDDSVHRVAE